MRYLIWAVNFLKTSIQANDLFLQCVKTKRKDSVSRNAHYIYCFSEFVMKKASK